jgi:hypothetical protein
MLKAGRSDRFRRYGQTSRQRRAALCRTTPYRGNSAARLTSVTACGGLPLTWPVSPVTVCEMPLCFVDQVAVIGTGDQTGSRKGLEGSDDLGCGGVQLLFDTAALRCPEPLDLGGR